MSIEAQNEYEINKPSNIQPIEEVDPDQQEKAKALARKQRRLMLIGLLVGGIYLFLWLLCGWSRSLESWLRGFTANELILVVVFTFVFGGIYSLINIPLSYYEGYILPHRYGLSIQTLKSWVMDQIKSGLIGGALGLLILEIIYAVLRAFPDSWWLIAAGILMLFNVLLANLAPVVLFPIFYKFKPLGETRADLEERLIRLAKKANTHIAGVFQFDMSSRTRAANAALTGLGNTRRIILGDTLLSEFSDDEIEAVLAHELGHHVHKDVGLNILLGTISTMVGFFLASLVLKWGVQRFGFHGIGDIAALPLFGIILSFFGLITMPLSNGFSRWRERLADQHALEMTQNNQAIASAMKRLANQNLSETNPEPWVEWLLFSHPSLEKRISMAENFQPSAYKG